MKTFYINRSAGDIIYSLPAIKAYCGGGVIINGLPIALHESLKPLVDAQEGFTLEHESYYGFPPGTINLEDFRYHPKVSHQHLTEIFAENLNASVCVQTPWLKIPGTSYWPTNVAIVNITTRYRDKLFNWRKELKFLKAHHSHVIFLGTETEHKPYKDLCEYIKTNDFLHASQLMKKSGVFSGTQSALLAVAEGMGMPYRFERSPFLSNTMTKRVNETVLNNRTRKLHFILSQLQAIKRKLVVLILALSITGAAKAQDVEPTEPMYDSTLHEAFKLPVGVLDSGTMIFTDKYYHGDWTWGGALPVKPYYDTIKVFIISVPPYKWGENDLILIQRSGYVIRHHHYVDQFMANTSDIVGYLNVKKEPFKYAVIMSYEPGTVKPIISIWGN